jgi:PleD family two-component response regulator
MSRPINNVFYTDDNPDDHLVFSMALNDVKPSAILHSFYKCEEIIDYLKDDNKPLPDIIFLDQNMQGNRTNECLHEIKRIARSEHIPIIMYTTGGSDRLVGNALELGASKYVIKPVIHRDIKQNLASILCEYEKK